MKRNDTNLFILTSFNKLFKAINLSDTIFFTNKMEPYKINSVFSYGIENNQLCGPSSIFKRFEFLKQFENKSSNSYIITPKIL